MDIRPYEKPLPFRTYDEHSWRCMARTPLFELWSHAHQIRTSGVLYLLEAAHLPRAELIHMGAPIWLLDQQPEWTGLEVAVPLLGRICWDAQCGDDGEAWSPACAPEALALGHAVVETWFR